MGGNGLGDVIRVICLGYMRRRGRERVTKGGGNDRPLEEGT